MKPGNSWRRWWIVVAFALAMAWLEAAVVYYLRTLVGRLEPWQPDPLPIVGLIPQVELARELATLVMLLTVGALAGCNARTRWGYTLVAFGVWDIAYYASLKVITGWPRSLLDWDVLFLIPLPWWGPVLAPMLIALLMILWGTLATQREPTRPLPLPGWLPWAACAAGVALALYVFMADTLRVAHQGLDAVRAVLPQRFPWPLFLLAWLLMAAPVLWLAAATRAPKPPAPPDRSDGAN
ncbi:MAG: hypothetical protein N3I86_00950 [Verrucomicrobiae bacterium]|nr:hypothetical protein [Verrucomicrobiae bacterium]